MDGRNASRYAYHIIYCHLFMAFLSRALGLNVRTRLASMVRASPVWGLRPRRSAFCLTIKLPNPDIFRFSPDSRVVFIIDITPSSRSNDSFLEKPSSELILSTISAFVTPVPPSNQKCQEDNISSRERQTISTSAGYRLCGLFFISGRHSG